MDNIFSTFFIKTTIFSTLLLPAITTTTFYASFTGEETPAITTTSFYASFTGDETLTPTPSYPHKCCSGTAAN
jgi:hypothetical protein